MKFIYVCDCCEEVVEEVEFDEGYERANLDSLTGEEGHDIMKMAQGAVYFTTLCPDCEEEFNPRDGFSFIEPRIH